MMATSIKKPVRITVEFEGNIKVELMPPPDWEDLVFYVEGQTFNKLLSNGLLNGPPGIPHVK